MKKTLIISALTAAVTAMLVGSMAVAATTRDVAYDDASGMYIDSNTLFAYTLDEDALTATVYGNPDGACDEAVLLEPGAFEQSSSSSENTFVYGSDCLVPSSVKANGKVYTVTEVAENGFADHTTLSGVTFESDVKIGSRAFFGCKELASVDLSGIATIGDSAFSYTAIETLSLPSTLTEIGNGAFFYIPTLTTVNGLGNNVKYIGSNAFGGSAWLDNQTAEFVVAGDGILIKYNGSDTNIVMPSGIKGVTDCFSGNTGISSVDMSDTNITYISDNAFYGCHNLASVVFPASLKQIGDFAFACCSSLESASLGANIETIGFCAFSSAKGLKSFTCTSEKLTSVGECAFWNCSALETVELASCSEFLNFGVFWNSGIKAFDIPKNVKTIAKGAFASTDGMKVIIPRSVVNIDGSALAGENIVVICAPDSAAAVYAGLNFGEGSTNKALFFGDVNGDGKVNAADVIHFLKNIASNAEAVISDDIVADVDLDGIRSLKDIRTMVKSLAGDTNTVIGK